MSAPTSMRRVTIPSWMTLTMPVTSETATRSAGDTLAEVKEDVPLPPLLDRLTQFVRPLQSAATGVRAGEKLPAVQLPPETPVEISPAQPIEVELSPEQARLAQDAYAVFPIAYDGKYHYIAGPAVSTSGQPASVRSRGGMMLTLTSLPAAPEESPEAATRISIFRALKLGFMKILNLPTADLGLRLPTLSGDDISYRKVKDGELAGGGRVALLIHGFLSETSWMVHALTALLRDAGYAHVVTWDYETVTAAIRQTRDELAAELTRAGVKPGSGLVDIVAHSMGSLVTRALIAGEGPAKTVRRALIMGPPNGGTRIASAGDVVNNLASLCLDAQLPGLRWGPVSPGAVLEFILKRFQKGLTDLQSDSEMVQWVNSKPAEQTTPITVLAGDNSDGRARELFRRIFHSASQLFYGGANDLVVPVASMRALASPPFPQVTVHEVACNHFDYLVTGLKSRHLANEWIKATSPASPPWEPRRPATPSSNPGDEGSPRGPAAPSAPAEPPAPRASSIREPGERLNFDYFSDIYDAYRPVPGDASPAPARALVEATLVAEIPGRLTVGREYGLVLTLHAGKVTVSSGASAPVQFAAGEKISVVISLSDNLELVDDSNVKRLNPPETDKPSSCNFHLRAVQAGAAKIIVRLFQVSQEQVGYLVLEPTAIVAAAPPVAPQGALQGFARIPADVPVRVECKTHAACRCPHPDVILKIEEMPVDPVSGFKTRIKFKLTEREPLPDGVRRSFHDMGYRDLKVESGEFFQQRFRTIELRPKKNEDHLQDVMNELRDEGVNLFQDLFSEQVKHELTTNGHRMTSIQIMTSGHHIPWEMVVVPADAARPAQFLGERYEVTRWIEGYGEPEVITIRNFAYIAPRYTDADRLRFATDESAYLATLGQRGIVLERVTALPAPVRNKLRDGGFDVLHFVGHARQDVGTNKVSFNESLLELEVEEVKVAGSQFPEKTPRSLDAGSFRNREATWSLRRPLIFLNACQTGREDAGLTQPGGWAANALSSRAGAFVGTLWSVRDAAAVKFSREFYNALLSGATFGQAALKARRAVISPMDENGNPQPGDPSGLAYLVYAHPNARVEIGSD